MIALLFTLLTAILHVYFFVLESFLWTKPYGIKLFRMNYDFAKASSKLAANQGVYNLLLALGLFLSFIIPDQTIAFSIRLYVLAFVVIVGCYGWYSLKNIKIFLFQALPALIALLASLF